MIRLSGVVFLTLNMLLSVKAQQKTFYADSIKTVYHIPEMAFAVVSADTVFETAVIGQPRINTSYQARPDDRFHIGSNTKGITSFLAALLVKQGNLSWNTKFFDLFPELKTNSKKLYGNITLQDLLTFRGKLPAYSYTSVKPAKADIKGSNAEQRWQLARYFVSQKPMKEQEGLTPSNADYILAGLMLEKASGKPYKELVTDFGDSTGIHFGFDYPNLTDTLQPWGHDANLKAVPPFDNYKLNWLLSAGNVNVSLPDYIKFVRLLLKGIRGDSTILPQKTYELLLFGLPGFSFGWFNNTDPSTGYHIAYNEGNAGAFITQVYIVRETGTAYIIFTNSATAKTSDGIALLRTFLMHKYSR